jgi:hypothetical protein
MKRKLIFAAVYILITLAFNSCEGLSGCKTCKQVTYINGVYDRDGGPVEYCGAALLAIEVATDIVQNNERTTWECN